VEHPFPNMGEPEKAMCYLKDIQEYDESILPGSITKQASMPLIAHAVPKEIIAAIETNRQFGKLGSSLVWLQPLSTCYGWQLLDIFRVFYNFVEIAATSKLLQWLGRAS